MAPMVAFAASTRPAGCDVREALRALDAAVARQMVADVPVGAFLSGGIDSTLIVALMRRQTSAPIHTFSIRVRGEHDESTAAAESARRLGTTHHTIELDELTVDAVAMLPALFDEPFAETSALGVRALSVAAREHVKVALSGDGGDEIFGGYDSHRWAAYLSHGQALLPRFVRRRAARLAESILLRKAWSGHIRRALRFVAMSDLSPADACRYISSAVAWATAGSDCREASALLSRLVENTAAPMSPGICPERQAMAADRMERLPNAMLPKVDVASMAASIEVRVPMLDDTLVAFADQLHERDLVGYRSGKLLLRRALDELLPGGIAWAPKRGFALPLEAWMRQPSARRRMEELAVAHDAKVRRLTGASLADRWRAFDGRATLISPGAAATELLWLLTVGEWAERFGVEEPAPDTSEVTLASCVV